MTSESPSICPFCHMDRRGIRETAGSVFAIEDTTPVTPGHMLIIPFRHCETYFEMTAAELCDARELIDRLRKEIQAGDPKVSGFNIGINCGETAGQTVFHTHIHLIPRRKHDTRNPRGGVRGVIPDKMAY
ncbi:MAG: HIT family protein [Desulfobacterales bacterium]|nr:HIT family protein [Desulfobacterales bacterium]